MPVPVVALAGAAGGGAGARKNLKTTRRKKNTKKNGKNTSGYFAHWRGQKMRSARLVMRKRLGQHLLKNPDTVANIVAHAEVRAGERLFEIGPGTGNLTAHLLASPASRVYAVELDARLHAQLLPRVAALEGDVGSKLSCVRGDFLRVGLPPFDVLVANIPYQISSPVLHRLFAHAPLPRRAVIMFQKEFAERMVAAPGGAQYCRLSVNTQLLASARIAMRIGREQFRPPPKVDSAVVVLEPRGWPSGLDWVEWDALLRICFEGKNKTLRALLGGNKTRLAGLALASSPPAGGCAPRDSEGGDEGAGGDLVVTSQGTIARAELAATRERLLRVLAALGAESWRANSMPLESFQALYGALKQEGFNLRAAGAEPTYPAALTEGEWDALAAQPSPPSHHELFTNTGIRLDYAIPGSRMERAQREGREEPLGSGAGLLSSRIVGWAAAKGSR